MSKEKLVKSYIFKLLLLAILMFFYSFFTNNKILYAISPEVVLKNMKLITPEIKEDKRYIIFLFIFLFIFLNFL